MKKTAKRLSLGRETLRHLSETRLRQVAGAGLSDYCTDPYCVTVSQPAFTCLSCYCTFTCGTHCGCGGNVKTTAC